jgi:hypothetical protein
LLQVATFVFGHAEDIVSLAAGEMARDASPGIPKLDIRDRAVDGGSVQIDNRFKLAGKQRETLLKSQQGGGFRHARVVQPASDADLIRHDRPIGADEAVRVSGGLQLTAARLAVA